MAAPSPKALLGVLIVLSIAVALIQAAAYQAEFEVGAHALSLWDFVFPLILAWWVAIDSRGRQNVYRPFEFGWLVFYYLPVYLPYYLVRTRGVFGIVGLLGFISLYLLGFLLQLGLWLAS